MTEKPLDLITELDGAIGANLKKARERRGVSQADLAKSARDAGATNFHQTTVARIEAGTRALRASEAIALARILDTSLEKLAESTETVRLREMQDDLLFAKVDYDEALRKLVATRLRIARELDQLIPLGEADPSVGEDSGSLNVTPGLFEAIEKELNETAAEGLLVRHLDLYVDDPDGREVEITEHGLLYSNSPRVPVENIRERAVLKSYLSALRRLESNDGEHPAAS